MNGLKFVCRKSLFWLWHCDFPFCWCSLALRKLRILALNVGISNQICTPVVRWDMSCDIACVPWLKKLYNCTSLKLLCAKCQFYILQFSIFTLLTDLCSVSSKTLDIEHFTCITSELCIIFFCKHLPFAVKNHWQFKNYNPCISRKHLRILKMIVRHFVKWKTWKDL